MKHICTQTISDYYKDKIKLVNNHCSFVGRRFEPSRWRFNRGLWGWAKAFYSSRPGCRQRGVRLIHFFSLIFIFHQYSVSKIHFYYPFVDTQAWSCRRPCLGSLKLIGCRSLSLCVALPTSFNNNNNNNRLRITSSLCVHLPLLRTAL